MEPPSEPYILSALLLLVASLFSSIHAAFVTLGSYRLQRLYEDAPVSSRYRKLLGWWVENPDRTQFTLFITAAWLSILAVILSIIPVVRLADSNYLNNPAIVVWGGAFVVGSAALLIGFALPRAVGRRRPETTIKLGSAFLLVLKAAEAVALVVSLPVRLFVRIVGLGTDRSSQSVTEEDLEAMIRLGGREGSLDEQQEELLSSVMDFGTTLVKEIMLPRTAIVGIELNESLDRIYEIIETEGFSRYPVFEETLDRVVGVFFVKDLLSYFRHADGGAFQLRKVLREPYFVPETKRINGLMREFQTNKIHMAIVVDEFGGTAGIVTQEDIIEQVFGDIYDEYDTDEVPELREIEPGCYAADAWVSLRDIEDELSVEFPEQTDYDTLGGFLLSLVGKVPLVGDEFRWNGLLFRVSEADTTKIKSVLIYVENGRSGQLAQVG